MKRKLRQKYLGPFEILQRIGNATYRLTLPSKLSHIHDIFHVSMLRKHEHDLLHVIDYNKIKVNENTTFVEEPVQI